MDRREFLAAAGLFGVAGCIDVMSNKVSHKKGPRVLVPEVGGSGGGPPREAIVKILKTDRVLFLPDNKRILTRCGYRITVWDIDRTYRYPEDYIYDSNMPFDFGTVEFPSSSAVFDVSADGKYLVYSVPDVILIRDIDSSTVIAEIAADATFVYFGRTADQIISLPANGQTITIWDVKTRQPVSVFAGPGTSVNSVFFSLSPDCRRALIGYGGHKSATEYVLEPADDQTANTYPIVGDNRGKRMKRGLTISNDTGDFRATYIDGGKKALTRTQARLHQIWDLKSGECIKTFDGLRNPIREVLGIDDKNNIIIFWEFEPSANYADSPYSIVMFDWKTDREIERFPDLDISPRTAAISPNGRFLVVGGGPKRLKHKRMPIDDQGTDDQRCLVAWDRKEKKYRRIAGIFE